MFTPQVLARALALAALLTLAPLASAQTETASGSVPLPSPTRTLPPGFEPVPGGAERAESVNGSNLVIAAYAGFLIAFFGYIAYVVRRQAALSREIAELAAKLEKRP